MLSLLLLILAAILCIALVNVLKRYEYWDLNPRGVLYTLLDCLSFLDDIFALFGGILVVVVIICLVCVAIGKVTQDNMIADNMARREVIMSRIESGYCGYEECVIDEVANFNEAIRKTNRRMKSPWTSWLTVDSYHGIDPIDMELAVNSEHRGHYIKLDTEE